MTNGDLLSGESVNKKITVITDNTSIPLSFSDIKTIKMQGSYNKAAVITKTNGDTLRGSLDTDEISINLEIGPTIKSIYKDKINWIFVDQARKKAPNQFALVSLEGDESDGSAFPFSLDRLEQTININLEPPLGKRGTRMKLALIPAGNFIMGSGATEEGRKDDEGPVREVTISNPFYMGIYEVTQEQYIAVMGYNPSNFNALNNPVEYVSWDEATNFCKKLREITKMEVTLPTEAEWEYAARADSQTRFYFGDNSNELDACAWYSENSEDKTHPVGRKKPNKFGLYDMHGNVFEWCMDWYQGNYRKLSDKDPVGPKLGADHVIRGGCWYSDANICRSANRSHAPHHFRINGLGFRVIIILSGK